MAKIKDYLQLKEEERIKQAEKDHEYEIQSAEVNRTISPTERAQLLATKEKQK